MAFGGEEILDGLPLKTQIYDPPERNCSKENGTYKTEQEGFMNLTLQRRNNLKIKEYRDAFVCSQITTAPFPNSRPAQTVDGARKN